MGVPSPSPPQDSAASPGQHLATISHEGRFWDIYLEFEESSRIGDAYRACLAYSPADRDDGEPVRRTIPVIVESSYEGAVDRAHELESHDLVALLRSLLP